MRISHITVTVLAILGLAVGWLLWTEPHVRAYLCPACTGFHEVAPRLFVDDQASKAQVSAAIESLAAAKERVADFYPNLLSDPIWLFCMSGDCGGRGLPKPKALAYADLFVFVYPDGADATIIAHEMAHTELHQRVGSSTRLSQAVPAWFDEGLAVVISRDARYLNVEDGIMTGCKAGNWPQPPSSSAEWRRLGAIDTVSIYTAAACKVIDWLEAQGGAGAVDALLKEVRAGQHFAG
jgi:hypothetical protein